MGLVSLNGSKIDFFGRPYFWISCTIFRYYPEIHFHIHFEIKIHEKKFLDTKIISFSKPDFDKSTHTLTAWELNYQGHKKFLILTAWGLRLYHSYSNPDSVGVNLFRCPVTSVFWIVHEIWAWTFERGTNTWFLTAPTPEDFEDSTLDSHTYLLFQISAHF